MNIQPRERRAIRDDGRLFVHSIFETIQGEGPFCGTPCVFVRLAGCNLQCPACDTDYTSTRREMAPCEVLAEVNALWRRDRWRTGLVVVTGGEPFRQDLGALFAVLRNEGYYVQIESNGTLAPTHWNYSKRPDLRDGVYLVVSPKTPKLHPQALEHACALKYVVEAGCISDDGLPDHALKMPNPPARPPKGWIRPVYVQPLDDKNIAQNHRNTQAAVDSCMRHGYTLQIQVHKVIGVE